MKRLLIAIALMGMTLTPALAQPKTKSGKNTPARVDKTKTKAKRCANRNDPKCAKVVDFSKGDKVDGDRPTGDGDSVTSLLGGRFGPLIRLRTDFNDMIYKSAESL